MSDKLHKKKLCQSKLHFFKTSDKNSTDTGRKLFLLDVIVILYGTREVRGKTVCIMQPSLIRLISINSLDRLMAFLRRIQRACYVNKAAP
jgi:hypothetical protein